MVYTVHILARIVYNDIHNAWVPVCGTLYTVSGVHNQPRLLKSRSVNRPRFNWIFCQRTVASGYTIFSAVRPHLLEHGQPESDCMYS